MDQAVSVEGPNLNKPKRHLLISSIDVARHVEFLQHFVFCMVNVQTFLFVVNLFFLPYIYHNCVSYGGHYFKVSQSMCIIG